MRSLYEGILNKDFDGNEEAVDIEAAKIWLREHGTIKDLSVNRHGTIDAEYIKLNGWEDIVDFPEYVHLGHVKYLTLDNMVNWNGTNWPEKTDELVISNNREIHGFKCFGQHHIEKLYLFNCVILAPLYMPKQHNIKSISVTRIYGSNAARINNALDRGAVEFACKSAGIKLLDPLKTRPGKPVRKIRKFF